MQEKQGTRVPPLGQQDPLGEEMATYSSILGASLVAQTVKNLPVMQETRVPFLSQEDPLEPRKSHGHKSLMNKEKEPQKPHTVPHSKDAKVLEQHSLKTIIIHHILSNKLVWLTSRLQM